jgi:hypothetical protein
LKPSKTVDESFEIPSSGLSLSDTGWWGFVLLVRFSFSLQQESSTRVGWSDDTKNERFSRTGLLSNAFSTDTATGCDGNWGQNTHRSVNLICLTSETFQIQTFVISFAMLELIIMSSICLKLSKTVMSRNCPTKKPRNPGKKSINQGIGWFLTLR